MAWGSIEYRLTAWYSLLLFATLIALGTASWWGVEDSMRSAADSLLSRRVEKLMEFVETEIDEESLRAGEARTLFDEDLPDYLGSITEGELTEIRTESGDAMIAADSALAIPWHEPSDGDGTFVTIELSDGLYRVLTRRISILGTVYKIRVASSLEPLVTTRAHFISWALWMLPLVLTFSFAGGYFISRKALEPVARMTQLAAATNTKTLSSRLAVPPTGDAIEDLARAFNDMLERLEESVSRLKQFTADASHELRTPISVIRTTAELALRHDRSEDDYQRDMSEIHAEAQRLTALIGDLLVLARADNGTSPFPLNDVDLSAVVRSSCERIRSLAREKGLSLEFHAPEDSTTIRGHESSLGRMMSALLENATEHTPAGGSITVRVEKCAEGTRVRIADTGRGIPEGEIGRVFDRFYRVDPSRSRSSGGFGLGLSVAKWVADYHQTRIGVESEMGKGTAFTVVFPGKNGDTSPSSETG